MPFPAISLYPYGATTIDPAGHTNTGSGIALCGSCKSLLAHTSSIGKVIRSSIVDGIASTSPFAPTHASTLQSVNKPAQKLFPISSQHVCSKKTAFSTIWYHLEYIYFNIHISNISSYRS